MSEHHHSLKRETSHETNPLLYQMLTKPTLDEPSIALKGRAGRQGREERGRGRGGGGCRGGEGVHPSLEKKGEKLESSGRRSAPSLVKPPRAPTEISTGL